jgi:hypothetical protein
MLADGRATWSCLPIGSQDSGEMLAYSKPLAKIRLTNGEPDTEAGTKDQG